MANGFRGREILAALVPAVQAAWGLHRVAIRRPRTRQLDSPYAVVWFESYSSQFGGDAGTFRKVQQTLRVGILGRFAFPADTSQNVELEKLDRVNELVATLQAAPTFAGAILPLVSEVKFDEVDSPANAAFEVTLFFDLTTTADHH